MKTIQKGKSIISTAVPSPLRRKRTNTQECGRTQTRTHRALHTNINEPLRIRKKKNIFIFKKRTSLEAVFTYNNVNLLWKEKYLFIACIEQKICTVIVLIQLFDVLGKQVYIKIYVIELLIQSIGVWLTIDYYTARRLHRCREQNKSRLRLMYSGLFNANDSRYITVRLSTVSLLGVVMT